MPAYLGPSPWLVAHMFVTTVINSITLFALFVLLVRNIWCLAVNTTTIEGWEIERHKTLLRRARHFGGVLEGPDGTKIPIKKQEFPYDIGIWENIKQGMGTGNVRFRCLFLLSKYLSSVATLLVQPFRSNPTSFDWTYLPYKRL